jgi:phosphate:Na+ symporter
MSTTISILGGVGLFLLGMTVMTACLKTLAGSALRSVLARAAATPLSGTFWGAFATLVIQSSSATTMTTIGLVSAGLLTFPQGLGLVFGANIGTTGTGWLVALIGVRVSLTSAALPMIFVGAMIKLLGRGRVSGAGAALAGFGLVLFGLSTLQEGMGGLAERLHPADLPAVLTAPGAGWWQGAIGVITLVVIGLVMTALMQSSTAAIALTLSAYFAGAVDLGQGCALIIGQNIGTATSSAMAAIGASVTAKRLAVAYVLFKLIAALIALAAFPFITPLLVRASQTLDGVTLLAAYHTAYNVVGVAVLMPVLDRFTRFVESLLSERGSPLTRCLDPSALAIPIAAEEAVRRTIARALGAVCSSVDAMLGAAIRGAGAGPERDATILSDATDALSQAQTFMSDVSGPPESEDEQRRLTSTLHALDHTSRLAETARERGDFGGIGTQPGDARALQLCAEAMECAGAIAREVATLPDGHPGAIPPAAKSEAQMTSDSRTGAAAMPAEQTLGRLQHCASALGELRRAHRSETLGAVANGTFTAGDAVARVEAVRILEALTHHAWRSAAHLIGRAN